MQGLSIHSLTFLSSAGPPDVLWSDCAVKLVLPTESLYARPCQTLPHVDKSSEETQSARNPQVMAGCANVHIAKQLQ